MSLFQPFPNYVWNLSVAIALENGGRIGELMDMIEPLKARAEAGEDAGTAEFMAEWVKMADKLAGLAEEDLARGREFSAGEKLKRAAIYYLTGERMQAHGSVGREEIYAKALDSFERALRFCDEPVERVEEIPYEGQSIVGLLHRAPVEGAAPCVLYCNGLDSMKEMLWLGGFAQALAKRGIHTLCVDQPGTGEALRLHGLPATPYSERWASKWVDWLEQRPEVDKGRIRMTGISLGGHFAPRAVAYEPRFACGAAWGANHNWREVQDKRMAREGENPVPHYWGHVYWVFGATDHGDFLAKSNDMNLNGHLDRIKVPFLVTHGAKDRQISVDYARQTYEQLVNSPRRELKIFTEREGGVEHVGADNMSFGNDYIADWFAETLGAIFRVSASVVSSGPPARQAGTAHGVVLLAATIMPIMAITALIPVLPALLREFAEVPGSAALVPVALTVPALCVALFAPFAGWLSDRFGRKRLLVAALASYAISGFLPWFVTGLPAIIGLRVLLGVMEAVIMTVATALIGDYFVGERRERWIARQVMVGSIGATVLLAAGGLLGDLFGSRGPFLLYLASFAVAVAAALVLHEPIRHSEAGRKAGPAPGALLAVLPLALITFGVGFTFYTIFVQIGPLLETSGTVTPGMVGIAGAIVNLGVVAGALVFQRFSAKAGPGLLAAGLVAAGLGYAGVAYSGGFATITGFATLACLGAGIMLPNMLTWTMRTLPLAVRGQGLGVWTGAFFLGQFVAPLVVGGLSAPMGGLSMVIASLAAIIFVAALATLVSNWNRGLVLSPSTTAEMGETR